MAAIIHLMIVLLFSPLLLGVIGKTRAFFVGRWGPPLLQSYYDIVKLFQKGNVYSTTTTWIFKAAPIVSMAAILASSLVVPLGSLSAPIQFWGDVILFAYLYGLARFFIILAAMDTGSSFEGMGASREATFSCLTEVTLFLDFIILAFLSKSLSLSSMVGSNVPFSWHLIGPALLLVIVSYFLILLAENARIPVDDPATHLELTMIHEVMVLDYSGVDLAYIHYASAIKLFILESLLIPIILPFQVQNVYLAMLLLFGGLIGLAVIIGIVESTMARLRLSRVPYMLVGAFVLATLGLIVTLLRSL